jgi:hypothetical protein
MFSGLIVPQIFKFSLGNVCISTCNKHISERRAKSATDSLGSGVGYNDGTHWIIATTIIDISNNILHSGLIKIQGISSGSQIGEIEFYFVVARILTSEGEKAKIVVIIGRVCRKQRFPNGAFKNRQCIGGIVGSTRRFASIRAWLIVFVLFTRNNHNGSHQQKYNSQNPIFSQHTQKLGRKDNNKAGRAIQMIGQGRIEIYES